MRNPLTLAQMPYADILWGKVSALEKKRNNAMVAQHKGAKRALQSPFMAQKAIIQEKLLMNCLRLQLAALLLITLAFPGLASAQTSNLVNHIRERSIAVEDAKKLDHLIAGAGAKKLVLLGESTHGTHEYYVARDAISRGLVADHGFDFIVVEGDFPAIHQLNLYIKNLPGAASSPRTILESYSRYPAWMWGNEEFLALVQWLRSHNDQLPPEHKVGLYGMDVYNEWTARDAVLAFLQQHNSDIYQEVKDHYDCFAPFEGDSWGYARAVQSGEAHCANATLEAFTAVKNARQSLPRVDDNEFFFAVQNARVKHNAEKFYRKSQTRQDASAWNARASHMHDTATRLLTLYGEDAKGIVWAHNTHIGDASFTSMANFGQHNIGQLSRALWGKEQVFLIGFSTHKGTVKASNRWGSAMEEMVIPAAQPDSVEDIFRQTGIDALYLIFNEQDRNSAEFMAPRGHRAVGVVYNPENDQRQYVNTILPMRYDAFVFFETTKALQPVLR